MATKGEIADRRRKVQALWLRGTSTAAIAEQLKTPDRTIRRDVAAVAEELRATYADELHSQLARTVAHLRAVQAEAWALLEELRRSKDVAKVAGARVGVLNAITAAEQLVAKVSGLVSGDTAISVQTSMTTVTFVTSPEWQRTRAALLAALAPYVEARVAVAEALVTLEGARDGRSAQ
jgi:hypothetical protein